MRLLGIEEALENDPFLTARVLNHMPRWSTVPVLHRQTVGQHCFLVARYCMLLSQYLDVRVNMEETLEIALLHDDDELKTGDRPSPDKKDTNFEMPTIEHGLVKVADRLEAFCYTQEELHFGNKFMEQFIDPNWRRYVITRNHFSTKFNCKFQISPNLPLFGDYRSDS